MLVEKSTKEEVRLAPPIESSAPMSIGCFGNARMGKTFATYRFIEQRYLMGENTLVIDFSNSYCRHELEKNGLNYNYRYCDPIEERVVYEIRAQNNEELASYIYDALLKIIEIESFQQKNILGDAIRYIVSNHGTFSFEELIFLLENCQGMDQEQQHQVKLLLKKILHLNEDNITYTRMDESIVDPYPNITIVQLSGYRDRARKDVCLFFCELFWRETRNHIGNVRYHNMVLDEFQHMPFVPDSFLYNILREGGKYSIAPILATQYLEAFNEDQMAALYQIKNVLIFKCDGKTLEWAANRLASNSEYSKKEWEKVVKQLQTGEAILDGQYKYSGSEKCISRPIKVKICKNVN